MHIMNTGNALCPTFLELRNYFPDDERQLRSMSEQEFVRLSRPYAEKIINSIGLIHITGKLHIIYNMSQPELSETMARNNEFVQQYRDGIPSKTHSDTTFFYSDDYPQHYFFFF